MAEQLIASIRMTTDAFLRSQEEARAEYNRSFDIFRDTVRKYGASIGISVAQNPLLEKDDARTVQDAVGIPDRSTHQEREVHPESSTARPYQFLGESESEMSDEDDNNISFEIKEIDAVSPLESEATPTQSKTPTGILDSDDELLGPSEKDREVSSEPQTEEPHWYGFFNDSIEEPLTEASFAEASQIGALAAGENEDIGDSTAAQSQHEFSKGDVNKSSDPTNKSIKEPQIIQDAFKVYPNPLAELVDLVIEWIEMRSVDSEKVGRIAFPLAKKSDALLGISIASIGIESVESRWPNLGLNSSCGLRTLNAHNVFVEMPRMVGMIIFDPGGSFDVLDCGIGEGRVFDMSSTDRLGDNSVFSALGSLRFIKVHWILVPYDRGRAVATLSDLNRSMILVFNPGSSWKLESRRVAMPFCCHFVAVIMCNGRDHFSFFPFDRGKQFQE